MEIQAAAEIPPAAAEDNASAKQKAISPTLLPYEVCLAQFPAEMYKRGVLSGGHAMSTTDKEYMKFPAESPSDDMLSPTVTVILMTLFTWYQIYQEAKENKHKKLPEHYPQVCFKILLSNTYLLVACMLVSIVRKGTDLAAWSFFCALELFLLSLSGALWLFSRARSKLLRSKLFKSARRVGDDWTN
ncbi:uncharacterized protein LOC107304710 isoform X2 [Oryza brachyantha]|uniref:uncharacterized protein LOC107304710 isoform X2 n=1 Tax=Oryza brachyantha TaxID=4533 RepID=UPI00077630E4|nr:uncharacterized protein LOC107304710 isoform X2 [Oryza brachyantha]